MLLNHRSNVCMHLQVLELFSPLVDDDWQLLPVPGILFTCHLHLLITLAAAALPG